MASPLFQLYFGSPSDPSDDHSAFVVGGGGEEARPTTGTAQASALDVRMAADVALSNQLRVGDSAALDRCVHHYGEQIVRVARVITGSRDSAWDVAQEVFIELWRTRERIDPNRSLSGYLYRATRHRAIDFMRRERSLARVAQGSVLPEGVCVATNLGDVSVDDAEFRARVYAVLAELPPRCREIFLLSREAGLGHAEIADLLGVSNATVRNQVSRATRHLGEALAAGLFDDWVNG